MRGRDDHSNDANDDKDDGDDDDTEHSKMFYFEQLFD